MLIGCGKPMAAVATASSVLTDGINYMRDTLVNNAYIFRGQQYDNDSMTTKATDQVYDPSLLQFYVPIRLPFSSMCALDRRLFFDTRLLTQPIQVTFIYVNFLKKFTIFEN